MMTDKEFESRILEMMKDKAFVEELASKAAPEDVQAFLASKGISCTLDQVKQFGKALKEQSEKKELSAGESKTQNLIQINDCPLRGVA